MKVLVLGGGLAGTTAALQAGELGADVTLVEVKGLGGTSLNEGSAPDSRRGRLAQGSDAFVGFEPSGSDRPGERLIVQFVLVGIP